MKKILNQASVSIRQLDDGRFDVDVTQSKEGSKTVKSGHLSIQETHELAVEMALCYLKQFLSAPKYSEEAINEEEVK